MYRKVNELRKNKYIKEHVKKSKDFATKNNYNQCVRVLLALGLTGDFFVIF